MGHGLHKVFTATMPAAGSTFAVDLGRTFSRVYLQIPTMASSTGFDVWAGVDATTLYQVRREAIGTTTAQSWTFSVGATAAANGGIVPIPPGFQFYKIAATDSAPSGAHTFKIICGDS